jgi:hypothetical protein
VVWNDDAAEKAPLLACVRPDAGLELDCADFLPVYQMVEFKRGHADPMEGFGEPEVKPQ